MTTHSITISGNAKTGLVYNDAKGNPARSIQVRRGDRIEWKSEAPAPFAIHFGDRTPLGKFSYASIGQALVGDTVETSAASGAYKYSISLCLDLSSPPVVDDPEVVIN